LKRLLEQYIVPGAGASNDGVSMHNMTVTESLGGNGGNSLEKRDYVTADDLLKPPPDGYTLLGPPAIFTSTTLGYRH
jgi:hypothetical protein